MTVLWIAAVVLVALLAVAIVLLLLMRRSGMTAAEARAYLRDLGIDLVRLPGRLRRLAADPRTPRRARWWLIGLAFYVAIPFDPIPDFLPVIGHLDEIVLVPLVLRHVRGMIPDDVWQAYFPRRSSPVDRSPV